MSAVKREAGGVENGVRVRRGLSRKEAFDALRQCPEDRRGTFYITPIYPIDRDNRYDILAVGWKPDAAGLLGIAPFALRDWRTWTVLLTESFNHTAYWSVVHTKYAPYGMYASIALDAYTDIKGVVRTHKLALREHKNGTLEYKVPARNNRKVGRCKIDKV